MWLLDKEWEGWLRCSNCRGGKAFGSTVTQVVRVGQWRTSAEKCDLCHIGLDSLDFKSTIARDCTAWHSGFNGCLLVLVRVSMQSEGDAPPDGNPWHSPPWARWRWQRWKTHAIELTTPHYMAWIGVSTGRRIARSFRSSSWHERLSLDCSFLRRDLAHRVLF